MSRFVVNRNIERELMRDPAVRRQYHKAARDIERSAKAIAQGHRASGSYLKGFRIAQSVDHVSIGNTDFAAHIIEWGSAKQPPQAILRRGVRANGLRLDETTK